MEKEDPSCRRHPDISRSVPVQLPPLQRWVHRKRISHERNLLLTDSLHHRMESAGDGRIEKLQHGRRHRAQPTSCPRRVRWVIPGFLFTLIIWTYYMFTMELCIRGYGFTMGINPATITLLWILFTAFSALYLLTFLQVLRTKCNGVPLKYHLTLDEAEEYEHLARTSETGEDTKYLKELIEERGLRIREKTSDGAPRYCEICKCFKPDRSHHCSICANCVLKMDHHCAFLNVCIGWNNHKFFYLFLLYSSLFVIFCTVCTFPYIRFLHKEGLLHLHQMKLLATAFDFYMGIAFTLAATLFFTIHTFYICQNRTTIEDIRDPIFSCGSVWNAYNLGRWKNWIQVFGESPTYWFLPVQSQTGNGCEFPLRSLGHIVHPEAKLRPRRMCPCLGDTKNVDIEFGTLAQDNISTAALIRPLRSPQHKKVNTSSLDRNDFFSNTIPNPMGSIHASKTFPNT